MFLLATNSLHFIKRDCIRRAIKQQMLNAANSTHSHDAAQVLRHWPHAVFALPVLVLFYVFIYLQFNFEFINLQLLHFMAYSGLQLGSPETN